MLYFSLRKLPYDLTHLIILLLHALEKLVLCMSADEIVLRICDLVVFVAVDVVHEETEHLLECDVPCGECKPVELALYHGRLLLVEVALCVGLEHLEAHSYVFEVLVILCTGVGVRPDGIAEVIQ